MKSIKFSHLLGIGVALSLVTAGCKHSEPPVTRFGDASRSGSSRDAGTGEQFKSGDEVKPGQPGGGEAATFDPDSMSQDRNALAPQTIYFDFDSSTIRPSEQSKLEAVASALKSDSSAKLLIEGNCDERGTEEYNRSLGERRALAAREALATLGLDPGRVATRSYGEDRPAATGHDESAWSKNRRDDFVLLHAK